MSEDNKRPKNLVCMNHVIDLHDNYDEAAWGRIWTAFIKGVEAEGGSAAGGMHVYGDHTMCGNCGPVTVCTECGAELEDE